MSGHRSYIPPTESPPSIDTTDEKADTPDSCHSFPVTPSGGTVQYFEEDSLTCPENNEYITEDQKNLDSIDKIKENYLEISKSDPIKEFKPSLQVENNFMINNDNRDKLLSNKLDSLTISNSKYDNENDANRNSSDNDNTKQNSNIDTDRLINITISQDNMIEKGHASNKTTKSDSSSKLVSMLTLTDDHPLMGVSSPESPPSTGQYPDLVMPFKHAKEDQHSQNKLILNDNIQLLNSDCSGVMSLSSTEDESFNRSLANGDLSSLHSESFPHPCEPQRNTSKNNLYFSENFIVSESPKSVEGCISDDSNKILFNESQVFESPNKNISYERPDILKLETCVPQNFDKKPIGVILNLSPEKKKIKPDVKAPQINSREASSEMHEFSQKSSLFSSSESQNMTWDKKVNNQEIFNPDFYVSEVSDFPESPSQLRKTLNYELPVEFPSTISHEIPSPDSSSASKPEQERSLYQAEVDPYGGCVTLKPRVLAPAISTSRKRIKPLLTETDTDSVALSNQTLFISCQNEISGSNSSLDTLSDCSLHSDGICEDKHFEPLVSQSNFKKKFQTPTIKQADSLNDGSETETETENDIKFNPIKNDGKISIADKIKEYSLAEERLDARLWLKVTLPTGEQRTIDMKVIEPYKRVLSHGGYALSGRRDAIVVFSACYLPDSSRVDYNYVMDNLFLYVLTTLEQLVTDDYILIYLHGSASKRSMPTFHWLKKCYQLIDRRLRKSLKHLYLVHPTFWLKSIMWMTRPFISSKFSRKLSYVYNLDELENLVPVEQAAIPEKVRRYDSLRT